MPFGHVSYLSAVAMMHALRRACVGALKGSKYAYSAPVAHKTALNSLPSCLVSRKYLCWEKCRCYHARPTRNSLPVVPKNLTGPEIIFRF